MSDEPDFEIPTHKEQLKNSRRFVRQQLRTDDESARLIREIVSTCKLGMNG